MTLVNKLKNIQTIKFSFGKATEFHEIFSDQINAFSMYTDNYGLGIPNNFTPENQLRAVFTTTHAQNGIFVFNISGVNLNAARKGFKSFNDAYSKNMVTEWELATIIKDKAYLKKTIFHNGIVEFRQVYNFKLLQWK